MSEEIEAQQDECQEEIMGTIVSWVEIAAEQKDDELYWKAINTALSAAFSLAAYKLGKSGEDYFKGLILQEMEDSFDVIEDIVPSDSDRLH
jgi:hypothetical protein